MAERWVVRQYPVHFPELGIHIAHDTYEEAFEFAVMTVGAVAASSSCIAREGETSETKIVREEKAKWRITPPIIGTGGFTIVEVEAVVCTDCDRPSAQVCPGTLDGHHSFERDQS